MKERMFFGVFLMVSVTLSACGDTYTDTAKKLLPQNKASSPAQFSEISLGRRLFEDVRLSHDSTISCATCHMPNQAFAEPRAVSHGIGIRARKRNAPSLINVDVFRSTFDWDGRAATIEEQLRVVFSVAGDMGIDIGEAVARVSTDSNYNTQFLRVFGRQADVDGLVGALVAFQRSLVVSESRFDRFYLGGDSTALSSSEIRGWELFRSVRSGCAGCHPPLPDPEGSGVLLFTDRVFHNLGVGYENGRLDDVGRYAVTLSPVHWGAFQTPSLQNVGLTAPYMHDGSLKTLEEVVSFYDKGGIRNPNLDPVMVPRGFTKEERANLAAFLRTLTTGWLTDSTSVEQWLLSRGGGTKTANVPSRKISVVQTEYEVR